MAQTVSQPAVY